MDRYRTCGILRFGSAFDQTESEHSADDSVEAYSKEEVLGLV